MSNPLHWARNLRSAILIGESIAPDILERLGEAAMVDLLGMFRRRPPKRKSPGFARSREDITALGDRLGGMLTSPVRDAPPLARTAPSPVLDLSPAGRPR